LSGGDYVQGGIMSVSRRRRRGRAEGAEARNRCAVGAWTVVLVEKCSSSLITIVHQHAMHTERDIVITNPSICPSNAGTVSKTNAQ